MRVLYLGTPELAVPALRFLATETQVVGVVTAPDRPRGRGRRLKPSPVRETASLLGLRVFTPERLDEAFREEIRELFPDLLITFAYGRILPAALLALPTLGAINIHPSLLPKFRGPAPIQRAIWAGEETTGLTIIRMVERLDAGPILWQRPVPIPPEADAGQVAGIMAEMAPIALAETLPALREGRLIERVQDEAGATYAPLIRPADEILDPARPAAELVWQIRALSPEPGATLELGGERVKIRRARALSGEARPGEIVGLAPEGLLIGTADGLLAVAEVQPPGRRPMEARAFVAGHLRGLGSFRKEGGHG